MSFIPGPLPAKYRLLHQLLAFIDHYRDEHGYGPNMEECATVGYYGKNNVHKAVTWLRERGFVTVDPYTARSIRVVQP